MNKIGKCNICNSSLAYQINDLNDITNRETLRCKNCKSISRDRIIMWSLANSIGLKNLLTDLKKNKLLTILETSSQRGHVKILNSKFNYLDTRFSNLFLDLIRSHRLRKFADLQNLKFKDNLIDYVLASDVLEHVRYEDKAFAEIFRTLKPDGYFLMTVPFSYNMEKTLIKVKPEGTKNTYLTEPEFHGGKSLVYRIYGKDIFKKLTNQGFHVLYLMIKIPKYVISKQEIFICRKTDKPDKEFLKNDFVEIFKLEEYD